MLIADLKGKLTLRELASEDFLTSSVFSVFRWTEPKWLSAWLRRARNIENEPLNIELGEPTYSFWPRLAKTPYSDGAEPDVVIRSGSMAIVVEAKFHSGKSSEGVVSCEPRGQEPSIETSSIESRYRAADQLAREYFAAEQSFSAGTTVRGSERQVVKRLVVLYVTKHPDLPKREIEETLAVIEQVRPYEAERAGKAIYWVNWQAAHAVTEEMVSSTPFWSATHRMGSELLAFLERRGLYRFRGFRSLDEFMLADPVPTTEAVFYQAVGHSYWKALGAGPTLPPPITVFYRGGFPSYWNDIPTEASDPGSSEDVFYRGVRG